MPDWINYYGSYSVGTVWDNTQDLSVYPQNDVLMQQMYEDYMASQQEEKELKEDKRKYPLFFLKKGIV